jgi:hypothetical protein
MLTTLTALLVLGTVDQGIFPDLGERVTVRCPAWQVSDGDVTVRIDPVHRLLTLFQGALPLSAYPLREDKLSSLSKSPRRSEILSLLEHPAQNEISAKLPESPQVLWGPPPRHEDRDGDGIVNTLDVLVGAKKLCENRASYVSNYRRLGYPNGDVPRTEGVCTDTLIRALRNAGWDLQSGIHEDVLRKPKLYPLERAPDANIDHRRIRMMLPYFRQNFVELKKDDPYLPGDLVLLDTFPSKAGADHAGIVSDKLGPSGQPLIVNNWTDGYVEGEMDLLPAVPILYRFRVPMSPRPSP